MSENRDSAKYRTETAMGQEKIDEILAALVFNGDGLIPAIAQQYDTGEILMLAWVNRDSLVESLTTGNATYWSRSRQSLWRKGETSGQTQKIKDIRLDCDGDTILFLVDQTGVACHTGRRTCFYRSISAEGIAIIAPIATDPADLYREKS